MITGEDRELFARSLRHATASTTGAGLDGALDELGWTEALDADARTAVSLLFELQGEAAATSSALDRVVARALGVGAAGGEGAAVAVVLPPLGPGDGDRGVATFAIAKADRALVVPAGDGGDGVVVSVPTLQLALRPVAGMDPDLGLVEVTGLAAAGEPVVGASWRRAVAAGRLALAHELVGASRAMLELARVHALERVQFGRPIAGFQAVRHRLADAYVAVEAAAAGVEAAWEDGSPVLADVAKAVAGRSAGVVARHAQQVLAGIGFTTEHPLHRYVRRTVVLDRLLGDSRILTRQLGEQVLRDRRLPPLLPL